MLPNHGKLRSHHDVDIFFSKPLTKIIVHVLAKAVL